MAYKTIREIDDADLEGVVACYCGCKYWENLRCISCGDRVEPELLIQLKETM